MAYHFELLGDDRFQKLCQSVIAVMHPDIQCLPVGQPDGGRDSFRRRRGKFIVYQVKFAKDPNSKTERDAVMSAIKSERAKVLKLVERGATEYHLLTNISGTSHLDSGSIDKVNAELSTSFDIPAYCWWRDDLERRIDSMPSVKWSYPEILKATDLIHALLLNVGDPNEKRRADAVRSYMAYQAKYDAQLKFKQIDLQKSIVDLFVDVPARFAISSEHRLIPSQKRWIELQNNPESDEEELYFHGGTSGEDSLNRAPGALQVLARKDIARRFERIVVEGAPGQGKSTVTQYLCLIYRYILLGREADLRRINPNHRPQEARIPFRVDLRDYASWLAGKDPFSDDPAARIPAESSPVLESFLAAQVHRYTGANFSVDDLNAVARQSQLLVVLDGFDEVADIHLRNRIVSEVSDSATRFATNALSCQFVVTSRPAAFANSPGFPRDEWQHLQLLSLSRKVIQQYTQKWLDGRAADARERRDILSVLEEKLGHAHIRDLARNPMQLTILLALISVQGASLPDKRTALYDKYIDIFLNRESEKSRIVRDHRELLVHIHRHLAWTLQGEAETSGAGHIQEARLKDEIKSFLDKTGHSHQTLNQLFSGIVERVVALVSRVQGTFEFEVQPLREYFAARYLYDTAPYSPVGAHQKGTLVDRFDAVSRNFYWLNVARFYAGCYNSGELASLIQALDELGSSEQFRNISHVPQLGFTLLADHVFSQQPKLASKLASNILALPSFDTLLATHFTRRATHTLALPPGTAKELLLAKCNELAHQPHYDRQQVAAQIMAANLPPDKLLEQWWVSRSKYHSVQSWLRFGAYIRAFERMSVSQCEEIFSVCGPAAAINLLSNSRADAFGAHPEMWTKVFDWFLDGASHYWFIPATGAFKCSNAHVLNCISALLSQFGPFEISERTKEVPVRKLLDHRGPYPISELEDTLTNSPVDQLAVELDALLDMPLSALTSDREIWSTRIEFARQIWGTRWVILRLAVLAAELDDGSCDSSESLHDNCLSVLDRALIAKARANDGKWWENQLRTCKNNDVLTQFVCLCAQRWASQSVISAHSKLLSDLLDGLDANKWHSLIHALEYRNVYRGEKVPGEKFALGKQLIEMSPRGVCLFVSKLRPGDQYKTWTRLLQDYDGDDVEIHRMAMRIALSKAESAASAWEAALNVVARAHAVGAIPPPLRSVYANSKSLMPLDIARRVCSIPAHYPLVLVGIAESILAAAAGSQAIPVIKVAARDEWFAETH
ncbi:hypothetical protein [Hyphomicrobium sp. CS1GBMeth3]|uniref:NACHT domain-containing protein n=1 Tax=Hyphomicrobium sp. CS1GBMeth3 TaxID=1892845 RepID=UPI000B2BE9C5|nr:hypothetical protein [Hyphomicrobium sp. CS1GBMeth3]